MDIGITGHRNFEDASDPLWVEGCIREGLAGYPEILGLTSLAKGADQLFARVVLELGGQIHAILPFDGYAESFEDADEAAGFEDLIGRSGAVTTLQFAGSKEQSYLVAGQYVVDHSELLIAVWEGKPAAGVGGTADVVAYARKKGKAVYQINPLDRGAAYML